MLIVLFSGCQSDTSSQTQPSSVEVGIVTLKKQPVSLTQEMSGRIRAMYTSEVRPQVSGIIKEQYFKEGSFVKQNEVLYKIDPASYQATYDQSVALLKSAEADKVSTELKYNRYKELLKVDGISQQDVDDARASYLTSIALIEQRKAQLESAKIDLERTDIKAPISGYIGISNVTKGALVTASQTNALATIRYTDRVYVDLSQSSAQLLSLRKLLSEDNIKKGSADVTITLVSGEIYDQKGKLELQEVSVDESTGSVTLRAEFDNQNGTLLPGMFVRASIEGVINDSAFLVPQQAVLRDTKANPIITVVNDNGSVQTKIIDIQRAIGNKWVAVSGVSEDDKIIIEGLNRISSRSTVSTVDLTSKYITEDGQ